VQPFIWSFFYFCHTLIYSPRIHSHLCIFILELSKLGVEIGWSYISDYLQYQKIILESTSSFGFNCESNSWICIIINELIGCISDDLIQKLMCDKNLLLFDLEHLGVVKVFSNAGFFCLYMKSFPPEFWLAQTRQKIPMDMKRILILVGIQIIIVFSHKSQIGHTSILGVVKVGRYFIFHRIFFLKILCAGKKLPA